MQVESLQNARAKVIKTIDYRTVQWRVQRGFRGSLEPHSLPPTPPTPILKYPMKLK